MLLKHPPRWIVACLLTFVASVAGGCGAPSFLVTPVANTSSLEETTLYSGQGWFAPKIAIISLEGVLMNTRTGGILQPQENAVSLFVQELNKAAADSSVKAIVLRVNSPGGGVTASDTMYETLKRFKERTHKPVIASTQDVAASGAYYVSCAADAIIAQPTSVVGSIGVIFESFNVSGTLAKLGASAESIKSGPNKDMGSPFKPLDPEARRIMQGLVDEYYARFVKVVTSNRKNLDPGKVALLTDGRVFSGQQAVDLGLADKVGLLDDAISLAKQMVDSPGAAVVAYKRPYGYGGSIYANNETPQPKASSNVLQLSLPLADRALPGGFYYIWQP